MTSRLLVFGCFSHDPQSILAAVYRLAFMAGKGFADLPFRSLCVRLSGLKLLIAGFTDANHRGRGALYNPEFPLLHDCSLAYLAGRA
jgi:hypothetical protein